MQKKLITIIMPAFNSGDSIHDAIESIRLQTYSDWELLIVNDASKDDTVQVIEQYTKIDNRITLLNNKVNSGVSFSRNKAIEKAKGYWIAFLDSDDQWDKHKLKNQIDFMKRNNADFSFTGAKFIDSSGKQYINELQVPHRVDYKKLKYQNVISTSSVIIRASLIGNNRMGNDKIHEDYVFWLKILKDSNYAYGFNDPSLIYRISTTSKSGNKLKSLGMVYGVHKELGDGIFKSMYYGINHLVRASIKYFRIYSKGYSSQH